MSNWLPLTAWGAVVVGALVFIAIYQSRRYREYMNAHIRETQKITDGQAAVIRAADRQAAAMERIADALEKQ